MNFFIYCNEKRSFDKEEKNCFIVILLLFSKSKFWYDLQTRLISPTVCKTLLECTEVAHIVNRVEITRTSCFQWAQR